MDLARKLNIPVEKIMARVRELHEFNPMLGFRGCRLGIRYPEITAMQARAVFEAAVEARRAGVKADAPEFCRFRNGCLHGSSHLLSDRELTFPRIFQLGAQARILN